MRILVVEDEPKLAAMVAQQLAQHNFSASLASDGKEAESLLKSHVFSLVLLDLMLPGQSGLELLRSFRGHGVACPVLILTSRDAVEDRVLGLDAGADDYLVKPFALPELLARIRALLRRTDAKPPSQLHLADLRIDIATRRTTREGRQLDLTQRESRQKAAGSLSNCRFRAAKTEEWCDAKELKDGRRS
ncbi:MAG TPA: response regulator transcription factor [Acidobacteriaceae bacterium]|nr:response regulator transcription factor [Acidobacteriaceae bacterium]